MASTQDAVGLSVVPGVDLVAEGGREGGVPIAVRLAPPPGSSRVAVDVCCIVDVSGSMGTEAMLKTETGDDTGHGLSVLDIVKHSLKTIIMTLTGADRLALVAYSNNATTIFNLTTMDDSGKVTTEQQLDQLQPSGMTNLWDGLKTGMELLKVGSANGRLQYIMLFTDGMPNINPPRGILPMLKKLKDKEPGGRLPCIINTFGFGYELDSELLSQLAIDGSGAYAFIPDAGFVGTVFVNSMSNLLVTMAKDVVLTLRPQNGASFVGGGLMGGHPSKKDGDALVISLGSLQYGQTKDIVVQMSVPNGAISSGYLQATLEYGTCAGAAPAVSCKGSGKGEPSSFPEVEQQRLRLRFVETVRESMQTLKLTTLQKAQGKALPLEEACALVLAMAAEIKASPVASREAMVGLLEDATGQVSEALSREDWYTKWGIHYLPSLMFAHLTQQCNNFKDAGVQSYGGELFQSMRDAADDIFMALPPPKPSARPTPTPTATPTARVAAPAPAFSMSAYYDRYGGCIDGACSVQLADSSHRRLDEVRRGDLLLTPGGGQAAVACVARTLAPAGHFLLTELPGGLRLTPHHPVHVDGAWRFPAELALAREVPCEAVYALLLEEGAAGSVLIEGVPCVSLGHGLEEGAAQHAYFGCHAAVERDLAKFPGFEEGFVDLPTGAVQRDPDTGLVCGLHPVAAA